MCLWILKVSCFFLFFKIGKDIEKGFKKNLQKGTISPFITPFQYGLTFPSAHQFQSTTSSCYWDIWLSFEH